MLPPHLLPEATARLIRTVDALPEVDYAAPSSLPGWTRATLLGHLALNAEGLARALDGVLRDEHVCIYDSDAARNAAIAQLGAASPAEIRDRLFAACTLFAGVIEQLSTAEWHQVVERTPGGLTWPASQLPWRRLVEVEFHHADLDAGYGVAEWTEEFSAFVVEWRTPAVEGAWTLSATDTHQVFPDDGGGPTISGSLSQLAWWLTGRPSSEIRSDQPLPKVSPL